MLESSTEDHSLVIFVVLVASFAFFSLLECICPRRPEQPNMTYRWVNNIVLAIITNGIVTLAQAFLIVAIAWWVADKNFGLLQLWNLNWFASLIIAILYLELIVYLVHRLMHTVPWLWRVHAVHHSDTEFDVTLAYRNHPLAAIFIINVRLPFIILLGAPVEIIFIYEIARIVQDIFSHSNIRIPREIERYLRYIIVTPDFHRVHHSSTREYTDSNFSSSIPLFDYIFSTSRVRPYQEHEYMQIGLEYFRDEKDTRIDQLLTMPFRYIGARRKANIE